MFDNYWAAGGSLHSHQGYTILDNVVAFNNSVYVISDTPASLPSMNTIVSTAGNAFDSFTLLSTEEARKIIGTHGALYVSIFSSCLLTHACFFSVRGVSWMSTDQHPGTFLGLLS